MKKRADLILEKIGVHRDNVNKENVVPSNRCEMAETDTINLMDQNISESTPENEKIMSSSPSVIENSPDRSILYNDPKSFLQHSGKKVLNKCGIELEPELTSKKIITTDLAQALILHLHPLKKVMILIVIQKQIENQENVSEIHQNGSKM
nr:uncharacterized protein LOC128677311 [Plodia interpunctella]